MKYATEELVRHFRSLRKTYNFYPAMNLLCNIYGVSNQQRQEIEERVNAEDLAKISKENYLRKKRCTT